MARHVSSQVERSPHATQRSGGPKSGQSTGSTQGAPAISASHVAPGCSSLAHDAPATGQSVPSASTHAAAPAKQLPMRTALTPYCCLRQSFRRVTRHSRSSACRRNCTATDVLGIARDVVAARPGTKRRRRAVVIRRARRVAFERRIAVGGSVDRRIVRQRRDDDVVRRAAAHQGNADAKAAQKAARRKLTEKGRRFTFPARAGRVEGKPERQRRADGQRFEERAASARADDDVAPGREIAIQHRHQHELRRVHRAKRSRAHRGQQGRRVVRIVGKLRVGRRGIPGASPTVMAKMSIPPPAPSSRLRRCSARFEKSVPRRFLFTRSK